MVWPVEGGNSNAGDEAKKMKLDLVCLLIVTVHVNKLRFEIF